MSSTASGFGLVKAMMRNSIGRRRVEHLILYATARCPVDCAHCFVPRTQDAREELTVGEVEGIAAALNPLTWLNIGGGEPFLRDDLVDICLPFQALETAIPTSGWLVDKTVRTTGNLHRSLGDKLYINVSIDGFKETHDKLRRAGSFDRAMETLEALMQIDGLRVSVVSAVCNWNVDELPEFIDSLGQFGLFSHNLNLVRGTIANPEVTAPTPEELRKFVPEIIRVLKKRGYQWRGVLGSLLSSIQLRYSRRKWDLLLEALEQETQPVPCLAGRSHLVVWPNGDVAPCELLPPQGNLRNENLDRIMRGPAMQAALGSIRSKACWCTHECNMLDNVFLSLPSFCRVMLTGR